MMELEEKYDGTRGKIWWNQRKIWSIHRKNIINSEEKLNKPEDKISKLYKMSVKKHSKI